MIAAEGVGIFVVAAVDIVALAAGIDRTHSVRRTRSADRIDYNHRSLDRSLAVHAVSNRRSPVEGRPRIVGVGVEIVERLVERMLLPAGRKRHPVGTHQADC